LFSIDFTHLRDEQLVQGTLFTNGIQMEEKKSMTRCSEAHGIFCAEHKERVKSTPPNTLKGLAAFMM